VVESSGSRSEVRGRGSGISRLAVNRGGGWFERTSRPGRDWIGDLSTMKTVTSTAVMVAKDNRHCGIR
jgi:hypothetical protein